MLSILKYIVPVTFSLLILQLTNKSEERTIIKDFNSDLINREIGIFETKISESQEVLLFEYNFDNSVTTQPNNDFTFIGSSYLQFSNQYGYKPNPDVERTIYVTDYTSVSKATSNGEVCNIPFEIDGTNNYFCKDKQDATNSFECQTASGLGDCTLGIKKI
jgi:hypothetical protein